MKPLGTIVIDISIRQRWRAVWNYDLFYFLWSILLQGTYRSDYCANFRMPGENEFKKNKKARRKEVQPEIHFSEVKDLGKQATLWQDRSLMNVRNANFGAQDRNKLWKQEKGEGCNYQ